jgi:hypothetical protein
MSGVVITQNYKNFDFNALLSVYELQNSAGEMMVQLPEPVIDFKGNKIKITADGQVSVLSVDSQFKINNVGTFDWDISQDHVIRLITVRGRTLFGVYDSIERDIKWSP